MYFLEAIEEDCDEPMSQSRFCRLCEEGISDSFETFSSWIHLTQGKSNFWQTREKSLRVIECFTFPWWVLTKGERVGGRQVFTNYL